MILVSVLFTQIPGSDLMFLSTLQIRSGWPQPLGKSRQQFSFVSPASISTASFPQVDWGLGDIVRALAVAVVVDAKTKPKSFVIWEVSMMFERSVFVTANLSGVSAASR